VSLFDDLQWIFKQEDEPACDYRITHLMADVAVLRFLEDHGFEREAEAYKKITKPYGFDNPKDILKWSK
jgi:hypothetical protein